MRISVIIPCHDAEEFVAATLVSVLNQMQPPDEVIVVDDGSTDGSAAVVERFGEAVRLIRTPNRGAPAARLAGVEQATGDALMFLDADDLIAPDTLASLAAVLADHPDAVAVCPWRRYERVDDTVWVARAASCAPRGADQDDLSAWLTGWYHPPCAALWSRAAYDRSGGWDAEVPVNNDGDVMMRGFVAGNRLVLSETGTGFYRRLPGERVSLSGTRTTRRGLLSKLKVLDRIAGRLAAEGRLAAYTPPLAQAYARLAADAAGEADIARRASEAAARLPPAGDAPRDTRLLTHAGAPRAAHRPRPAAPMPPGGPKVSVVIPTYNRAGTIGRAVDSVLGQDFRDLELLVIDDGSTDGTAEVLARRRDPRLRHICQPVNGGVAAARNRGIAEARAPYIAFLDSDDEWLPGKLAAQVARMDAAPAHLGLVNVGVENVLPDRTEAVIPRLRGYVFAEMLYANRLHGGGSGVLIRREALALVGGFDERLPAIEDYELWLRVCRFFTVDHVEAPLVRYHDAGVAVDGEIRRSRLHAANILARRMLHDRYGEDMRRAGTEAGFLIGTASRQAAGSLRDRAAAARTLARAIRSYPARAGLYALLPLLVLPAPVRDRTVNRLRALRRMARAERP